MAYLTANQEASLAIVGLVMSVPQQHIRDATKCQVGSRCLGRPIAANCCTKIITEPDVPSGITNQLQDDFFPAWQACTAGLTARQSPVELNADFATSSDNDRYSAYHSPVAILPCWGTVVKPAV